MPEAKPKVNQIEIKVNGQNLPTDMIDNIAEVEVNLSMTLPDMFILRIYDVGAVFTNDNLFSVGNEAEIKMTDPDVTEPTPQVVFKGEITAVEPEFQENNKVLLTVRGYDKSHRLNRATKTQTFVNSTDSDVVEAIAGEVRLSPQVTGTSVVYDCIMQDAQTDLEFLNMLATRNGFEWFVNDGKLYFGPPNSPTEHDLEWGTTLRTFNPRMTSAGQVNGVVVRGWDYMAKSEIVGTATSSDIAPQINVGGSGVDVSSTFGNAEYIEVRAPVFTVAEADKRAKAILDSINANFVEARGVARCKPQLKLDDKVKVQNLGSRFSGTYVVTSVTHVYAPGGINDTYFTVEGKRPRLMSDLISSNGTGNTQNEVWAGVVPAIVTDIDDPESLGRVKVKYPWLGDEMESWWCRVVSIGAGGGRGLQNIPEVDDEVLVAFEHGNFNFPYVIGNLWNGQDAPPEAQAVQNGKVEVRSLRSRDGHVIRLTDGQEPKIEIIDCNEGTSITFDAQGKHLTIDTNQDITIKGGNNVAIEASGDMSLKGTNVKVEASSGLNMKGGSSSKLESGGTTEVKGSLVKLN